MTGKTMAEHAREYRTRKAKRVARMEAALKSLCDAADAVKEIGGGAVQHSALRLAAIEGRNALAKPTNT